MIKVAINGFGRIGRSAFKIAYDKFGDQIEIVAVNDLADNKTLADLLKHDSNYGLWKHEVSADEKNITVSGFFVFVIAVSVFPFNKASAQYGLYVGVFGGYTLGPVRHGKIIIQN